MTQVRAAPAPAGPVSTVDRRTVTALATWGLLVAAAALGGVVLVDAGRRIGLQAPPLLARWDPELNLGVVVAVVVGAAAVAALPGWAARLPWRLLLPTCFAVTVAWSLALGFTSGWSGVTEPIDRYGDYLVNVPDVGSPREFLANFTDRVERYGNDLYGNHVRSHPPGMVVILWGLDRLGFGGPVWATLLYVAGGASAVPAVLLTTRALAGEETARAAAPFVAVAPAAIWIATSADAFFAGVGAWSAAAVIAALDRRGRGADALAVVGGLGFGVLLMLHYALALLGLVPLVVAVQRRRVRSVVLAALAAAAVLGTVALAGFWWVDGLQTSSGQYRASIARRRPLAYFAVANLAALAVALGPALAVALARLPRPRWRQLWPVVAGALLAVAVADVSGFSKGEVERIWLPFTVWLLAAGATLAPPGALVTVRRWLGLQVGVGLAVEVALRTGW